MAADTRSHQPYSNPIALPDRGDKGKGSSSALTNDDFRRLMVTPRRVSEDGDSKLKTDTPQSTNSNKRKEHKKFRKVTTTSASAAANNEYIAKIRKEEEEREAEWAKKYRDRAKERRAEEEGTDEIVTSGYRAVAPNTDPSMATKKRKQTIDESKFLGGDIEHTHLVKGLDYALLQKVKSEITQREIDHHEQQKLIALRREREKEKEKKLAAMSNEVTFKTKIAMNIFNVLFESKPQERNESFLPGRMAYVFELDDEFADSDIPTTLIRSRADCPSMESQTTLSTNDIVINKLTQILSYLRQGTRTSKRGKRKERMPVIKEKPVPEKPVPKPKPAGDSIFDDVGEYVFDPKKAVPIIDSVKLFDKSALQDEYVELSKDIKQSTKKFVKAVSKKYGENQSGLPSGWSKGETDVSKNDDDNKKDHDTNIGGFGGFTDDHYAECYPGGIAEVDATVNSDDDTDFTKMDLGNRKGPVKRWDFDNEDEYNDYQSNREALPKAAFQYGVKMNDGRKTRRQGVKNDKAKLDREWNQISQILQKRKSDAIDSVTKRLKTGE